jgi:hypothetical protein
MSKNKKINIVIKISNKTFLIKIKYNGHQKIFNNFI